MFELRAFGVFGSALALTGLLGIGPQTGGQAQGQNQMEASSKNAIEREPVVIFDVSGGTLLGPVFEHLTIYNDGFASYSSVSPTSAATIDSRTVNESEMQDLMQALEAAGTMSLRDQEGTVTDVPLTTVTVFSGGTNARSHTYSYWLGSGAYSAADDLLGEFIETQFSPAD